MDENDVEISLDTWKVYEIEKEKAKRLFKEDEAALWEANDEINVERHHRFEHRRARISKNLSDKCSQLCRLPRTAAGVPWV